MPLNKTGRKVKAAMVKQYGKKKGEEVFYATMNKYGKKWHHSPDVYDDTALGETPPRTEYHGTAVGEEMAKKAGGTPGGVQQADGTANPRADGMTKMAGRASAGGGKTRYPAIDRFSGENV